MRWAPVLVGAPGHAGGRTKVGAKPRFLWGSKCHCTLNKFISIPYTRNTTSAVGKGVETGYGRSGVRNQWSNNILVNFNQYWPIRCCHMAVPDWSTSTPIHDTCHIRIGPPQRPASCQLIYHTAN